MPLGTESIVLRIMRLEKWLRKVSDRIADLADQIGQLRLNDAELAGRGPLGSRAGEIVIVRPLEAIGMASFTEEVPADPEAEPPVPYAAARLVPATGDAVIWQDYDADDGADGEMRAFRYVRRWIPEPEPDGEFISEDAIVEVDNFNPSEGIPSTARYIICVRRRNGRLKAITWECPLA